MSVVRSPLFYVGDKYKLMSQLSTLFPKDIDTFYDVFCGGGSVSMNTPANKYYLNDVDDNIIDIHKMLQKYSADINVFINDMYEIINYYNLSHSEYGINKEIENLKKEYKKTYFAKYNKEGYLKLREDYNNNQYDIKLLYILLIYGFNRMIRYNKNGNFNIPVGNVDWNKNVTKAVQDYGDWINNNNVNFSSYDFIEFVQQGEYKKGDFLYFDPPYLITFSDYNKLWTVEDEKRLYYFLDKLDKEGIYWGLSNMTQHKGKINDVLLKWLEKYNSFNIKSNYISRFDNTIKNDSKELYITNYNVSLNNNLH